jgi:hypothetical protein
MVSESTILAWAKDEAARLVTPPAVRFELEDAARREELAEDRRRAGIAYQSRAIGDDEFSATIAGIDAELARLDDRAAAIEIPAIDWSWPTADLNAALRALWAYIELDDNLRPVRAEWLVPEWRR